MAMSPKVVEATALSLGPGPQSLGREGEEVTAPLSWWPLTTSPSLAERRPHLTGLWATGPRGAPGCQDLCGGETAMPWAQWRACGILKPSPCGRTSPSLGKGLRVAACRA